MNTVLFAAAAALAVAAYPVLAQPVDDNGFIQKAVQIDTAEIQMGHALQQKGATPQVRHYGEVLVHDHTLSRQKAEAAAHAMGVDAPEQPLPAAAPQMTQMQPLSGAAFDQDAKRVAIEDHRDAITLFMQEGTTGHGPAAAHARATLPTLRKHLAMAEALHG
jgi:putative membrane protein